MTTPTQPPSPPAPPETPTPATDLAGFEVLAAKLIAVAFANGVEAAIDGISDGGGDVEIRCEASPATEAANAALLSWARRAVERAEKAEAAMARETQQYTEELQIAVRVQAETEALADRLAGALRDMAAQHRCGCGHPSCNRCGDDAENTKVLLAYDEARKGGGR